MSTPGKNMSETKPQNVTIREFHSLAPAKYEAFGRLVAHYMDGTEWDADLFDQIAIDAERLGIDLRGYDDPCVRCRSDAVECRCDLHGVVATEDLRDAIYKASQEPSK
jgi:hypothetical protein